MNKIEFEKQMTERTGLKPEDGRTVAKFCKEENIEENLALEKINPEYAKILNRSLTFIKALEDVVEMSTEITCLHNLIHHKNISNENFLEIEEYAYSIHTSLLNACVRYSKEARRFIREEILYQSTIILPAELKNLEKANKKHRSISDQYFALIDEKEMQVEIAETEEERKLREEELEDLEEGHYQLHQKMMKKENKVFEAYITILEEEGDYEGAKTIREAMKSIVERETILTKLFIRLGIWDKNKRYTSY